MNDLNERIKHLNLALEYNKILLQQIELKRQEYELLNNENEENFTDFKKFQLMNFNKPYIRDARGMSAPSLFKSEHEFVFDQNIQIFMHPMKMIKFGWSKIDEDILLKEVKRQHKLKQNRPFIEQLEKLLEVKDKTEQQRLKIIELNSKLKEIQIDEEPERLSENIDWLAIAKHLPEKHKSRTAEDCELYYNNFLHRSINHKPWTEEEDVKLLELVKKYKENKWELIAKHLNTGRLAWQCCARFQSTLNPFMKNSGPIEGLEAENLNTLINQCKTTSGNVAWTQVNLVWEGRVLSQIKNFYKKTTNLKSKGIPWSRLEDCIIYAGIKYYSGRNKFSEIAKHLPLRTNVQIRERYIYRLKGRESNQALFGSWKPEEDLLLVQHAAKYLKNEKKINYAEINQQIFPHRNPHQLYTRFRSLRKKLPDNFYLTPIDSNIFRQQELSTRRVLKKKNFRLPKLPKNRNDLYKYILDKAKLLKSQIIND